VSVKINIFPDFRDKLSDIDLKRNIDLITSVINYSKGNFLNKQKIVLIEEKLGEKLEGTRLYPGGSSVLFGWGFSFKECGNVIFKPYYSRDLSHLIIHYLSVSEFYKALKKTKLHEILSSIDLKIPEVIGLAKTETFNRTFPILITEEMGGDTIMGNILLVKSISQIAKHLARKGVICDPYPANWKYCTVQGNQCISYIDLLSSNLLFDATNRIGELIQSLQN
jgi:hypothetical protein